MPGTQPTEAYYSTLDQSLKDAPTLLKSKRALPRREKPGNIMTAAAPVRSTAFASTAPVQKAGATAPSPLNSPYLINRTEGLPPTPPSNSNDTQDRTSFSPPRVEAVQSSLTHKTSTSTTPLNQRKPPTPDATPPGSLNVPQLNSPSGFSSTRAESFRTAREEPWSSDEEGHMANGNVTGPVKTIRTHRSRDREPGLGLEFEREDEDTTPTQRTPKSIKSMNRRKTPPQILSNGLAANKLDHIPDREWDTSLMRNVTVRRKKNYRVQPIEDENRISEREIVPQLTAASSEEEELEPQTPSVGDFTPDRGWPGGIMPRHIRDDSSSNRLSTSSTVIEALIVASPSQSRRQLRHVSKNLSLRSEAGSSTGSSPITRSTRTSLGSRELSTHSLHHKQASIADGRRRSSPVLSRPTFTPPKSLKHHRESASLADAFKHDGPQDRRVIRDSRAVSSTTMTSNLSGGSTRQRESSAPTIMIAQTSPPRDRVSTGSRLSRVQFKEPAKEPPNSLLADTSTVKTRVHSPTRSATQKAIQRTDSLNSQRKPKTSRGSLDATIPKSKSVSAEPPARRLDIDSGGQTLQPSPPEKTLYSRQSISTVEEARRPSLDRSTVGSSYENTRLSVDHSTIRSDEHAMARHLFAQTTPFSQTSDTLEVSEATAVSIYPHNNNSLLVVEQTGRSSAPLSQLSASGDSTPVAIADHLPVNEAYPPALMVQPATPPQMHASVPNVDSPLRNPRKPPQIPLQLPAIRVLPATPSAELEDSPLDVQEVSPMPLTRSFSLKERARHYSDSFVRPIIARTTSLRHTYSSRPRSPYRQQDDEQRRSNLHPFWQPRGFWDEFSDSDSDFGEPEEGSARLPPGGDTSDVPEPRGGFARVLDGFRGSGGFLIGNSMGLERHGSNNRRHYISVPAGKRSVVRKTSQGTLKSISSSSQSRSSGKRHVWRGLGLEFHYLGVSAMRIHLQEKKREKNRDKIRRSIGPRFVVEGAPLT
jgi:hypothetical protein